MQAMHFTGRIDMQKSVFRCSLALAALFVTGCHAAAPMPPVAMHLHQQWQLQPGDRIAGYEVSSGLGDIVIELAGKDLYMPVDGRVRALDASPDCSIFLSPEIPAYRMRLCGLKQKHLGDRKRGQSIGRGDRVSLAMLRKQADGTWTMVEPATQLLEQFLDVQ